MIVSPAIEARGLSKRYGQTVALDALDLTVRRAARSTASSASTAPARRRRSACCSGSTARARGSAQLFGHDVLARVGAGASRGRLRRRRAGALWPALTAAETFEHLARLRGGADSDYRRLLIERFKLDPDRKLRAPVEGQSAEGAADRRVCQPRAAAAARRADRRGSIR